MTKTLRKRVYLRSSMLEKQGDPGCPDHAPQTHSPPPSRPCPLVDSPGQLRSQQAVCSLTSLKKTQV